MTHSLVFRDALFSVHTPPGAGGGLGVSASLPARLPEEVAQVLSEVPSRPVFSQWWPVEEWEACDRVTLLSCVQ